MKLLKFSAAWCGPCKHQNNVMKDFNTVPVITIDVDDDTDDLCTTYAVRNLPTMILIDDENKELHRFVGTTSLDKINDVIKNLSCKNS